MQSAAERADPLEIRIYGGNDADFELYEDGGDSYAYEHGANATIHLHWDDHRKVLFIGDRSGTFPGMLMKHTLQIVLGDAGTRHRGGIRHWFRSLCILRRTSNEY